MAWRLFLGGLIIVLGIVLASQPTWQLLGIPFTLAFIGFIMLVRQTKQFRRHQKRMHLWEQFLKRQQLRQQGLATPRTPFAPHYPDKECEILSQDINLFGTHSIFDLFDECLTHGGQTQLAQWLLKPQWNAQQIQERQEQFKQLSNHHWKMLKFCILGAENKKVINTNSLASELKHSILGKNFNLFAKLHLLLFPTSWILLIANHINHWPFPIWWPLAMYFLFSIWSHPQVKNSFARTQNFSIQLKSLIPLFEYLEDKSVARSLSPFIPTILENKPSKYLKRVNMWLALLSTQGHPLVHLTLNVLMPWDYGLSYCVEKWRRGFSPVFPKMMNEIHHLEATLSCYFLYHYQSQTFPNFSQNINMQFQGLMHPLLPTTKVVANSFHFTSGKNLALITGSNMSGKSTFLRTIGVNQQLALMGCPVFAHEFISFVAPVKTCLQISDSLEQGYSSFYYEVKRMSDILSQAAKGNSFIYLIDEIFRGTNNRERLQGSQAVLAELLKYNQVLGLVSTHDLELTNMVDNFTQLENWHFKDDISHNQLSFSYIIQPGPCPTTNALKIMASEGLPIKL